MTVAIPANMDALGCEFAVVVANHNHNKAKVYLWSRALQAPFLFLRSSDISLVYLLVRAARPKLSSLRGTASEKQDCSEFGMLRWATREI